MREDEISVKCCIAGGGPAGMMLGLLLARAGIDVLVLEKHADFLRDFRGDTIHPSTLQLMHELGVLERFLRLPHQKAPMLIGQVGEERFPIADFTHLPSVCKFIALMPQWDFLDFLAREGQRYPGFHLRMKARAVDLIEETGHVAGLVAETAEGPLRVKADLVIGADGRHSTIREKAGLTVESFGAPMDVLWFRISRRPDDPDLTTGRFDAGQIFVQINRGEHWQCACVIGKGSLEQVRAAGLEAFRNKVATAMPYARDRVGEITAWDDVKLLTVAVDRLNEWYRPGLLCIGDAAHAMSPVGGVGINLAIQDAVAAANILTEKLRHGAPAAGDLRKVQARRMFPTRVTQAMQVAVQKRVIANVLGKQQALRPPLFLKMLGWFPVLRRIPARVVGIGVRPEHIRTPEILRRQRLSQ